MLRFFSITRLHHSRIPAESRSRVVSARSRSDYEFNVVILDLRACRTIAVEESNLEIEND